MFCVESYLEIYDDQRIEIEVNITTEGNYFATPNAYAHTNVAATYYQIFIII